jgi:hypothetical protein
LRLEARRAGEAIAASAGELARLWRATHAQRGSAYWPGILDGLVDELFLRLGEGLAAARDPALVWPELGGVVRLDARAREASRAELDAEWDDLEGVLAGAREALAAPEAVAEWLARAAVLARAGSRALAAGGGPAGVLVVWWLSPPATRRPRAASRT